MLQEYDTIAHFTSAVPVDIIGLSLALGVDVAHENLDPGISGMLEKIGEDRFKITVNANDPETRQRFTIAHELGHFMLHRNLIGDGVDDDRAYRSTDVGKYHNTLIGKMEETEANQFAASLLMPKKLIARERIETPDVSDMAAKFKVSRHSMSIRMGVPYIP
jgi:Zn-dependent peptidase ImmA (M78 family)